MRSEAMCGSHLTHSQSAILSSLARMAMRTSSGSVKVAVWTIMARARARAMSPRPAIWIRETVARSTPRGRSLTSVYMLWNCAAADSATGSDSPSSEVSAGTIVRVKGWSAVPTRMSRNSLSDGSRSPTWVPSSRSTGRSDG